MYYPKFLGFYYKQNNSMTCTWYLAIILYHLVIFRNFPNPISRFAAHGILENSEISLAVLLPIAITYTNTVGARIDKLEILKPH